MHGISGRTALSKKIKEELISLHGAKCFIYNVIMDENDLQIDHRVPWDSLPRQASAPVRQFPLL